MLRRARAMAMAKGYREYDGERAEANAEHLLTAHSPRLERRGPRL